MTYGNSGLGRYQGLIVFVPYTAPGERVRVQILKLKKHFAEAKLLQVLTPNALRRTPPCSVFGICGGCDWQHMSYELQVQSKIQMLQDILRRQRIQWDQDIPFLRARDEWAYRNRIQVFDDGKSVGFRQRGEHTTVPVTECLIAEDSINNTLKSLQPCNKGRFEIRANDSASNGFEQVNSAQNKVLVDWLKEQAGSLAPQLALDLFCGSGNLTFPLCESLPQAQIIGVEGNPASIERAKAESISLQVDHLVSFQNQAVASYLENLKQQPQLVVLDPPREGAGIAVMRSLDRLGVTDILYISCDPMTWARDCKCLLELDQGWSLQSIVALDLFPQTHHVELLTRLKRN